MYHYLASVGCTVLLLMCLFVCVVLCPSVLLFMAQTGYRHTATDAHEVASMVVDAAGAAEELEVVVVVLSEVRHRTHFYAVQLCLLHCYGPYDTTMN